MVGSRDQRMEEWEWLMDTEFQFWKMRKVLEVEGSDDSTEFNILNAAELYTLKQVPKQNILCYIYVIKILNK